MIAQERLMFSASYVASLLATLYCSVGQSRVSRFRGNDSSCIDGGACTRALGYMGVWTRV